MWLWAVGWLAQTARRLSLCHRFTRQPTFSNFTPLSLRGVPVQPELTSEKVEGGMALTGSSNFRGQITKEALEEALRNRVSNPRKVLIPSYLGYCK